MAEKVPAVVRTGKKCDSYRSWDCVTHPEGFAEVVLPAGSIIYRGTPLAPRKFAFFAGRIIADIYSEGGSILRYRVVRDLRLLDASNFGNLERLLELSETKKERDLIRIYFSFGVRTYGEDEVLFDDGRTISLDTLSCTLPQAGFPGYICTEGFYDPKDRESDFYLARAMLRLVCQKTGLDGWIHFGIWPRARVINGAGAISFHDEIAICDPASAVAQVPNWEKLV
ncbi:MAG: hypothetical protein ACYCOU_07860 [Sulfobacillus sp.]